MITQTQKLGAAIWTKHTWLILGVIILVSLTPAVLKIKTAPPSAPNPSAASGLTSESELTAPLNLQSRDLTPTSATISWQTTADDSIGFAVFRNGINVATTQDQSYKDAALTPGNSYTYTVVAFDDQRRTGPMSSALSLTTPLTPNTSATPKTSTTPTTSTTANGKLTSTSSQPAPAPNSFVTRSGTQLLLKGAPYRFTGLNIYNANSRNNCAYTMGTGPALDQSLAAWGSGKEVFRSWFFQALATTNGARDWAAFDHTLAVAKARGYRVIATLVNQWPDCEGAGLYKTEGWYDSGYKTGVDPGNSVSYRQYVSEVVSRYKNDPTILMWQLVNEAEAPSVQNGTCNASAKNTLRAFADDMGGLIKSIDGNHLVSFGSLGSGQCGLANADYQYVHASPHIDLCEYHDYLPGTVPGDQWNGLQVRINQCKALGKPLFVGETGLKATETGGTLQSRADTFADKFAAQFNAGVVGQLVWAWMLSGSTLNNYDIGPGDPTLNVLGNY